MIFAVMDLSRIESLTIATLALPMWNWRTNIPTVATLFVYVILTRSNGFQILGTSELHSAARTWERGGRGEGWENMFFPSHPNKSGNQIICLRAAYIADIHPWSFCRTEFNKSAFKGRVSLDSKHSFFTGYNLPNLALKRESPWFAIAGILFYQT